MTLEQKEKSSIFSFGSLGRRSGSKCIKWDLPPTPCLCHLFIGQLNSVYILVENALTNGWPTSAISSKAIYMCVCIYIYVVFISVIHLSTYAAHYAALLLKPTGFNYQGLCVTIAVYTTATVKARSTRHGRRKPPLLCRVQLPLDIQTAGLADI